MSTTWYQDDTFWEQLYPFLFSEERWKAAGKEVDGLESLMKLQSGTRILDMGCGPGRHSLELARRGYRVTAVDRCQPYLNQLKASAETESLSVERVCSDMREFSRPHFFDGAISMFTSLGYFENEKDDLKILTHIHESLNPGGKMVLEMLGKEVVSRIFQPRDWRRSGNAFLLEERYPDETWGYMENHWMIVGSGVIQEWRFKLRMYSAVEMSQLLGEAGFAEIHVFGCLKGTPYDASAERLIILAIK